MRGGTRCDIRRVICDLGLSPHARGNLIVIIVVALVAGPIPACAGEPWCIHRRSICAGAYPRMRGGTIHVLLIDELTLGLSPHARGNL